MDLAFALHLLGKAQVCDLVDSVVGEDIFGLEIAMDDSLLVHFLCVMRCTPIPLMICFSTKMASFSGMVHLASIYFCRLPPLQNSITMILSDTFSYTS